LQVLKIFSFFIPPQEHFIFIKRLWINPVFWATASCESPGFLYRCKRLITFFFLLRFINPSEGLPLRKRQALLYKVLSKPEKRS